MEWRFGAWTGREAKLVVLGVPHDCGITRRRRLLLARRVKERSERGMRGGWDQHFVRLLVADRCGAACGLPR